mgnify:CR=1 FL=1
MLKEESYKVSQMDYTIPTITYEEIQARRSKIYLFTKKLIDIVGASLGLILLSPLFLIIIVLIKIDDFKAPIFFGHERVGKDMKHFKCWKFRTMVPNAQKVFENFTPEQKEEFAVNFKLKDDPRITKIGNVLRKTSLDELPQIWNILVGQMSIVGPRPIVDEELEKYGQYQDILVSVKPGLTGLWQCSARSNCTYEERVTLDMEYISSRSLKMDMIIIFKTFGKVFRREGAY